MGEHFGHILEYMRDGMVAVAEAGARPSLSLLHALKREFDFYCIELVAEQTFESEMTYAIGGYASTESGHVCDTLASMERYDPLIGQWSAMEAMGTARYSFGACISTYSEHIYVFGGFAESDDPCGEHLVSVERYSPTTDYWRLMAPLPHSRSNHGSAIYVLGGAVGRDTDQNLARSVYKFSIALGTWNEVAPMPDERSGLAACVLGSLIFVFGGFNEWCDSNLVQQYDTEADAWSTIARMPCSRLLWQSASANEGMIYITGVGASHREVLQFDPATRVWTTLAQTIVSHDSGASFVSGGHLHVAGGRDDYTSVERYDAGSDTWAMVTGMLERRGSFQAVTVGFLDEVEPPNLFDVLIAKVALAGP
jgi:N-acetylneuraminic acid mutarotase